MKPKISAAFFLVLSGIICVIILTVFGMTYAVDIADSIAVYDYDDEVDYMRLMRESAEDGSPYALIAGAVYEKQRNLKIRTLSLPYEETTYFLDYDTGVDILAAIQSDLPYTQEDLDLLSRAIYAEAGCDWIPDWVQLYVGSVVMNRVQDSNYPDTIRDVLWQKGQYSCVSNGSIWKTPDERTIENARRILEDGSVLPSGVIGQSSKPFGTIYESYYDSILGTTTYFFYGTYLN